MARLGYQDLKDVLRVTYAALGCSQIDQLRKEVLYHLEKVFKCDGCTFFLTRGLSNEIDYNGVVFRNIDKKSIEGYADYYHDLDPFVEFLYSVPLAVDVEQLIPYPSFLKTEYYNDFLKPQAIHYQLSIILRSGKRLFGGIGMFRPLQSRNFSSRDKAKAELISSYLAEIIEKNILLDQTAKHAALLETLFADPPHKGKLILNESLDPIYTDENARKLLLTLETGNEGQSGLSPAFLEKIYQRCEELKNNAHAQGYLTPPQHCFDLVTGQGEKLSVFLRLTKSSDGSPVYLVFLESEDSTLYLNQRLRELGLTRREGEVVCLVLQGLKNTEISAKLFISRYTVENHLKSIYRKLGIGNRTILTQRLRHLM